MLRDTLQEAGIVRLYSAAFALNEWAVLVVLEKKYGITGKRRAAQDLGMPSNYSHPIPSQDKKTTSASR